MLHFKQRDGHGICVNSSTNIARTHSRTCYKIIVLLDNYKNEQVVLKAITLTNKATTCTHLRRPSLNINRNGSQCTHTVTDMDLTRNT